MPIAMETIDTFDLSKQRPPHIAFHTNAVQVMQPDPHNPGHSMPKLDEYGQPMYVDVDYVTIRQPGGTDSVIFEVDTWLNRQVVAEVDAQRLNPTFVRHYKALYEHYKQGKEMPIEGTPIKMWPVATPAQVKLLNDLNIRSVEDLATLPDDGVKRLGMGGVTLKNKAMSWLMAANDKSKVTEEMTAMKSQNDLLSKNLADLTAQIEDLKREQKRSK